MVIGKMCSDLDGNGVLLPIDDSSKRLKGRRVCAGVYLKVLEEGLTSPFNGMSSVWTVTWSFGTRLKLTVKRVQFLGIFEGRLEVGSNFVVDGFSVLIVYKGV